MVEVCGVKYVKGVGKQSGRPYEAYLVYFTEDGKPQGVEGFVTGDAFVDVSLLNGRGIKVGDQIDLIYNKAGFLKNVIFHNG